VSHLTVTVNAVDAMIASQIYVWVRYGEETMRGKQASAMLIAQQMAGIRAALVAGLALKVNTVLIPGVNDEHLPRLARTLAEMGVGLMNIVPLIPAGRLQAVRPPTCDELHQARLDCAAWVPQFRSCDQCRADVIAFPRRSH
jgi:nitrogen fixation protein NifB